MYIELLEGQLAQPDRRASELAAYVRRHMEEAGGLRALERLTSVSKGSIDNILENESTPEIETLAKFSRAFGTPLWRLIEMSGYPLGLPSTAEDRVKRLASLVEEMPDLGPIVDHLLAIEPDDLEGILAFLEAQQTVRRRRQSTQDE